MPRHTAADRVRDTTGLSGPTGGKIPIPYGFSMRSYQLRAYQAMDSGILRALTVWHRRSGKDLFWLNRMIKAMCIAPFCGTYLYLFPHLTQGRRDLWDAKTSPDSGGRPFRAFFPPSLVLESSETEMQITLRPLPHQNAQEISDGRGGTKKVGSVFQIMGTDKDSLENIRGMNTVGAVFSEWADHDPAAWEEIIEPIMMESRGWAAFNYTPKGKNHAFKMHNLAQNDPSWYTDLQTIEMTRRDAEGEDGSPIVTLDQIDALRRAGRAEEIIQQEYYCSYDGYLHGTIFGDLIKRAAADGRIGRVPHVTQLPVGIMFDIGRTDATAMWFFQCVGSEIRFIDYYANVKEGADHYAKVAQSKPYVYGRIILPLDARVKGFTASESTEQYLRRAICRNVVVADSISRQSGIDITRRMFSRFVFDAHHCDTPPHPTIPSGLDGLRGYRRKWDDDRNDYSGEPIHDQFSHPADSLRHGCVGWEEGMIFPGEAFLQQEVKVESDFDPRTSMGMSVRGR